MKKRNLLIIILLGLVGFYAYQTGQFHKVFQPEVKLDGKNEIHQLAIKNDQQTIEQNFITIEVKYRFTGNFMDATLRIYPIETKNSPAPSIHRDSQRHPQQGENINLLPLEREKGNYTAHTTKFIRFELLDLTTDQILASKEIEHLIEWPRKGYFMQSVNHREKNIETLYTQAVAEINFGSNDSLSNAKKMLEIIIQKDPRYILAYPELARYHMKTTGSSEGRRLAEQALLRGLEIDPNHANSLVLLGYVYTNQEKYDLAQSAFEKSLKLGTDNLWLWVNWGQFYAKQNKIDDAIGMYQKVFDYGRSYDRYDQARVNAYYMIIGAHIENNNLEKADIFHLKRLNEYPNDKCMSHNYAKFKQRYFDDPDLVLKHARIAQESNCAPKTEITETIALAYYSKWSKATDYDSRYSYLSQAQSHSPDGPKLFSNLAKSKKMLAILEKLVHNGAKIDVVDNSGFTALAYTIRNNNLKAAKALIALGANPNITIGNEKSPLIIFALYGQNKEAIKFLIKHGADLNVSLDNNTTVLDAIEQMGYGDILKEIGKET